MNRYFDLQAIEHDSEGKVVLNDDQLERIERSFIPTAGGTVENATTCNGTNESCQNTGQCSGSTNTTSCQNTNCHRGQAEK